MDRGGLSGDDGPTHHGLFDIGYLRHIPNIVHMQPKDEDEFVDMLWTMANYNYGPIAVRYPRGAGHGREAERGTETARNRQSRSRPTRSRCCHLWTRQHVRGCGRSGKEIAGQGFSVALVNPRWIKPLDTGTLEFFARSVEVICTMEDHVLHNGFGCAVMEHLYSQGIHTPVVRIGWPDQFIEHGNIPALRKKHGITAEALVEKTLPLLRKKSAAKSTAA